MITVQILEPEDIFLPDDWCRPLGIVSMSGGHSDSYSFKSMYTGAPENNSQWVRAKDVIGDCWFGSTVKKYNKACSKYVYPLEFVRGDIPKAHRLNMKGYKSLSYYTQKCQGDDDD